MRSSTFSCRWSRCAACTAEASPRRARKHLPRGLRIEAGEGQKLDHPEGAPEVEGHKTLTRREAVPTSSRSRCRGCWPRRLAHGKLPRTATTDPNRETDMRLTIAVSFLVALLASTPVLAQQGKCAIMHPEPIDWHGCTLKNVNLEGVNLKGANLQGIVLDGSNLARANLEGANLAGASLERVRLEGAKLMGANLEGAFLAHANLSNADLRNANLARALFANANLENASLHSTNSAHADFRNANTKGVKW